MKKTIRLLALLLPLVMIAGLVPVFVVSAEDSGEKGITLEKDTFKAGEDIIVSAIGEGKDWVGLYTADEPVDGSVQSVYWYYAAEHSSINIKEATKNAGRDALYDIPAGSYKFVLYANDSYEVLATKEFTVVSATAFEDTASFELAGGQGNSFPAHGAGQSFAFRYNIGADRRLKAVKSHAMATYSAPCQQVTHAVYQWKGSYAASVAGTPLFSVVVKDHPDNGPVNAALVGMGILKEPFSFLNSVWGNRGLIGLMNFLMWFGNTTIMLMAAIMGVDPTLYEAAELDGCTPNQMFWKITIPLIRPILVYVMITSMIGGLQMFDVPQILTNGKGGPDRTSTTMIMYLNNHLFSKNYGMAGAVSVVHFKVCAVLCVIVYMALTKEDDGLSKAERKARRQAAKQVKGGKA